MSGFLSLSSVGPMFNRTGSAGPRRLAFIGLGIAGLLGCVFVAASIRPSEPVTSKPGPLPRVNPLPGGLHSNPQQDALSVIDNQENAERARQAGNSLHARQIMPASQAYNPPPVPPAASQTASLSPRPQPAQTVGGAAGGPCRAPPAVTQTAPAPVSGQKRSAAAPASPSASVPASGAANAARTPQEDAAYKAALDRMMANWGGKMPRTEVILPPEDAAAAEVAALPGRRQPRRRVASGGEGVAGIQPRRSRPRSPTPAGPPDCTVLIPAEGRTASMRTRSWPPTPTRKVRSCCRPIAVRLLATG